MSYIPENILYNAILCGTHKDIVWVVTSHPRGHRNGYVFIPSDHPWVGFSQVALQDKLQVHGGITFTDMDSRWIGFDTAHAGDRWDGDRPNWDHARIVAEVKRLAHQIAVKR